MFHSCLFPASPIRRTTLICYPQNDFIISQLSRRISSLLLFIAFNTSHITACFIINIDWFRLLRIRPLFNPFVHLSKSIEKWHPSSPLTLIPHGSLPRGRCRVAQRLSSLQLVAGAWQSGLVPAQPWTIPKTMIPFRITGSRNWTRSPRKVPPSTSCTFFCALVDCIRPCRRAMSLGARTILGRACQPRVQRPLLAMRRA